MNVFFRWYVHPLKDKRKTLESNIALKIPGFLTFLRHDFFFKSENTDCWTRKIASKYATVCPVFYKKWHYCVNFVVLLCQKSAALTYCSRIKGPLLNIAGFHRKHGSSSKSYTTKAILVLENNECVSKKKAPFP